MYDDGGNVDGDDGVDQTAAKLARMYDDGGGGDERYDDGDLG
jgi:hypothetical protein